MIKLIYTCQAFHNSCNIYIFTSFTQICLHIYSLTQFTVGTSCLFFLYLVHESESNLTHLLEELLHSLAHSATANSFQTIGAFQFWRQIHFGIDYILFRCSFRSYFCVLHQIIVKVMMRKMRGGMLLGFHCDVTRDSFLTLMMIRWYEPSIDTYKVGKHAWVGVISHLIIVAMVVHILSWRGMTCMLMMW